MSPPDLRGKNYTPYHMHSFDSLLDSCTDFRDYVDLAVAAGMKAIASTEHGIPRSWVSKKIYCDEKGIKFMHGVEIYLTERLEPKVRDNFHTVLIAKNEAGRKELNQLIKLSSDELHTYYKNRLSFDEFLAVSNNIIKTSACLGSPLNQLPQDHPRYFELASHYDYLEVQPHLCEEQADYNKRLADLSLQLNIPLIAGTDTHSSSDYKAECRKMLITRKRKKKKKSEEENKDDFDTDFDMTWKTVDQLVDMFDEQGALTRDQYLEAIENTNRMADLVEDFTLDRSIKYPILYGSREMDSRKFDELIEAKLNEKLESGIILKSQEGAFREAIAEEVRVFRKLNMDGFMLSMAEILDWCRKHGIVTGPARGSVGGSRVAYVTDIIDLNPEVWNTVFSRFCNEDREEIGDIDIDVIEEDRPKIFDYITSRFGEQHTARVGSYGTIAEAGAIDDIGGALRTLWDRQHSDDLASMNPWALPVIDRIKDEYDSNPDATKKRYPELFYYLDGMINTRVSQSVHPAGIVISPLCLDEEYGFFYKDGERCLCVDMEELHEVGAAKYDFLVLKTVQVIRDTCNLVGMQYPKSHEINWWDDDVWKDMLRSAGGVFQMESAFAFDSLKKFQPKNLFDMSLVTACIRPSGTSYRESLLARKENKNPSQLIDDLLKDNLGYLIYQEDTIKFLQQVCGLSGSAADNIRRAIGRKQKDRLDAALPSILEGYCSKSTLPREQAEAEAHAFLQIIEDSASYQFGYNHSVAYCMLGYLCAYFRYYYPGEFITAFLNNAANDEDIRNGTALAKLYGIHVIQPKFGFSKAEYFYNRESKTVAKGVSSIKYMSHTSGEELYQLSAQQSYTRFTDVLLSAKETTIDSRQLDILIKIDFFSAFGNQRELLWIVDMFNYFKAGEAKQVKKDVIEGSPFEPVIRKYSNGKRKDGSDSQSFRILDMESILHECEDIIRSKDLPDLEDQVKVKNFHDAMGYYGYVSGREEDRRKLFIKGLYPVKRKKDGVQFGYNVLTQSIGSGVESRMTVYDRQYKKHPIYEGDIIYCDHFERKGPYFDLLAYRHIYSTVPQTLEELWEYNET